MSDSRNTDVVVGIDLGTRGVRALAVDSDGVLIGTCRRTFKRTEMVDWEVQEQSAETWWSATCECLQKLLDDIPGCVNVAAVSADGTAGTVLLLDAHGDPIHDAVMYHDARCRGLLEEIRGSLGNLERRLGIRIMSTFGLPKVIWLQRERPELMEKARYLAHPADFLIARLSGVFGVTDYANPLKTGYDPVRECWPEDLENKFAIPREWLPEVRPSGSRVGSVTSTSARQCKLRPGTPVILGTTDGVAALYASGACEVGSWNSSLGTTLVIRGITAEPLSDPFGMLQNYRHPDGLWVPGAASRVGCAWIDKDFADGSHCNLDRETENRLPTDLLRYPLTGIGEVFPFCDPQARGFIVGSSLDRMTTYAAGLEGVAFVERLAYERFEKLGARLDGVIRTNGGGSRSSLWLRLRASVLGRPLLVPRVDEGAMGAALLAATYAWYASMAEASKNMVHYRSPVEPDPTWIIVYERRFAALVNELSRRRNSAWPS